MSYHLRFSKQQKKFEDFFFNGEKKKSEIQKYCSAFVFQGVTTEWAPSPKQWEWHPQLHPQNYT